MNAIEQGLVVSDLNAARGNASLAQSHLLTARQLCAIHGLDCAPINLAKFHFEEAAKLIDAALGFKVVGSTDLVARPPGEGSAQDAPDSVSSVPSVVNNSEI